MTREEHEQLFELIANPPPGSKIAAAKEFGIDLTLLLRSLTLTPEQRAVAMEDALRFAENLRDPEGKHLMTDFEKVLRSLADAGVNFIIVGAYAAYAHGASQLTRDLDICYERSPENMQRLASAISPLHPRLRGTPEGMPFILDERTLANGMNFTLQTDLGDVDLFGELAGIGQFSELAQDAISITLHGRPFKVASLDAIIRSKKAAGRPKDLAALPELEAIRESRSPKKD